MVSIDQTRFTAFKQQGEKSLAITWVGLTSETVAVGVPVTTWQPDSRCRDAARDGFSADCPHADATHLRSIGHVGGARQDSVSFLLIMPLPSPACDFIFSLRRLTRWRVWFTRGRRSPSVSVICGRCEAAAVQKVKKSSPAVLGNAIPPP